MVLGIFKIALRLRDRHVFMQQFLEILNVFNAAIGKQIFWKTKSFLKKLEYCFLVESTKIKNGSFPCKAALPKANFKTNRMVSTRLTCRKKRSFTSSASHPEVFLRKGVLKICCRFTGEHPCRSAISIKLLWEHLHF